MERPPPGRIAGASGQQVQVRVETPTGPCTAGSFMLLTLELRHSLYEAVVSMLPAVQATTSATIQASKANAVNTAITCMHGITWFQARATPKKAANSQPLMEKAPNSARRPRSEPGNNTKGAFCNNGKPMRCNRPPFNVSSATTATLAQSFWLSKYAAPSRRYP